MSRSPRPNAKWGSAEHSERARRSRFRVIERERAPLQVAPADLAKLYRRRSGVPRHLRPLLEESLETVARLRRAAEGDPSSSTYKPLSEPRVVMLEGAGRLLFLAMAETSHPQSEEGDELPRDARVEVEGLGDPASR